MDIHKQKEVYFPNSILSPRAVEDFRSVFAAEYGITINSEQAQLMGLRLLRLFKNIYRPIPSVETNKNHGKR